MLVDGGINAFKGSTVLIDVGEVDGDFEHFPVFFVAVPAAGASVGAVAQAVVEGGAVVGDGEAEVMFGDAQEFFVDGPGEEDGVINEVLGGGSEGMFACKEGRAGAGLEGLGDLLAGLPEAIALGQLQVVEVGDVEAVLV